LDLELVDPLRDGIIVELAEWKALRDRFRHESTVFTVDLRGRCKNHPETVLFLETKDVLCPDGVGPPESVIEVLPIPTAKLGGEVIYEFRFYKLDDVFNLAIFTNIAPSILSRRVMTQVAGPDFVTVLFECSSQGASNRPVATSYENSHGLNAWRTDL